MCMNILFVKYYENDYCSTNAGKNLVQLVHLELYFILRDEPGSRKGFPKIEATLITPYMLNNQRLTNGFQNTKLFQKNNTRF